MTTKKLPQRGQLIKIIKRKCANSIQPTIKIGKLYVVAGTDKTKDGADVIEILDLVKSNKTKKEVTRRCNSQRFDWQIYTKEQAKEERLKQKAAETTKKLLHIFTFEEHMQMSFVPLIISHCAWVYAEKVTNYCIENWVDETKKLTRCVKELKKQYDAELRKDLDQKHIDEIVKIGNIFIEETAFHFVTFEYSVRNELIKEYPSEDKYIEIKVLANVALLICKYYVQHSHECDLKIQRKLKDVKNTTTNPKITELAKLMKDYASGKVVQQELNINTAMAVMANDLKKVKFEPMHLLRIKNN